MTALAAQTARMVADAGVLTLLRSVITNRLRLDPFLLSDARRAADGRVVRDDDKDDHLRRLGLAFLEIHEALEGAR